jgi:TolA-binding protein
VRLANLVFAFVFLYSSISNGQDQLGRTKTERLYNKGTQLVQHSTYGPAREVFTEFLKVAAPTDARRADAQYYIAYCALNLGHSDGEKLIEDFIAANPSNPRSATAYFDLACFFYNEKNYSKASQYFNQVKFGGLTADQQTEGHFKWGYTYFNLKKLDEALGQFNFVKTQGGQYAPAASYYAGFIEYSQEKYDEALLDLKRAESNAAYSTIVPSLIAMVYYKQRRYDQLIQFAESVKPRASTIVNYSEIAMLVADAYYLKKDYRKAADAYENYLENNKNKAEGSLLFRAGFANYSLAQDAKAIEYLKISAAKQDSVSYYSSYYLGILYLKQGNKPYAFTAFNHARNSKVDKKLVEESTFQLAKVAYDMGKPDVAIPELEKFTLDYPSSELAVEVKEILAQAYVNGNNYNKAIEYIEALPRRSRGVDQAYQKATYLKGSEHFNKDEYPEAVKAFEKSLASPVDPRYVALASFWCGEAYSIGRKYEEAVPFYQKVVSLGASAEPEVMHKTRYGLGYAHFNLKQYEQALFNFKEFVNKAPKNQPSYADAMVRLADCYYVSKAYQDAITNYNRARQLNSPDDDYILFQTGVINGILRKYDDARRQFNMLISNYPKSQYRDEAMFQRAQFEIEQGNYQQASDGLTQLIRENPASKFTPYAYLRRAASSYNLKQYDKTISDYQFIIKQYPTHPVAQQVLLPLQEALNMAGRGSEFENSLTDFKNANPENKNLEVVEYESAKNFYFDQQYQKAITAFNSFVNRYGQSARVPEATYYLAESYFRTGDLDKALALYTSLANDPTFTMGNRVVGRKAEIEFKQAKYESAVKDFHRLEKLSTNKKDLYTAWSGLMESFYLLAQYDSVNTYANLIIEKGNVNAGAQNKATLFIGKAAMARGDYETAKDEFLNTLNTARDEFGAEAKYRLGEIFYLTKQHKQCYETLISLGNDFSGYDEWIGKAYLLLADNFIAMGDLFQAKGTLESLIENNFPLQHIRNAAKDKLKAIQEQELKEKQKNAAADSVNNNR